MQKEPGTNHRSLSPVVEPETVIKCEPDHLTIPNDGTDVWEIDLKHLKFENKVASGSYGDLYVPSAFLSHLLLDFFAFLFYRFHCILFWSKYVRLIVKWTDSLDCAGTKVHIVVRKWPLKSSSLSVLTQTCSESLLRKSLLWGILFYISIIRTYLASMTCPFYCWGQIL